MSEQILVLVAGGLALAMLIGIAVMIARFFHKVPSGQALIISRMQGPPRVSFSGAVVLPVIQTAEYIDITLKSITIEARELRFADDKSLPIKVQFFIRVGSSPDDIIKVARSIGCDRASNQDTLKDLFSAKFLEAMKMVSNQIQSSQFENDPEAWRDAIIEAIGTDLNGYVLEDATIDFTAEATITTNAADPAHPAQPV